MDEARGTEPLQILIVGTGALATLFAWRLRRAGHEPVMLGTWQPGIAALRDTGVRLVDGRASEQALRLWVLEHPDEVRGVQQAIVLVKSWQTERAAGQLKQCLAPDGLAVTLQNGLGNYEILEEALGRERVALGSTTTGATLLGPGLVKAAGEGTVSIQTHPRLGPLEAALRSSGFHVEVVQNAKSLVWSKLVINSAINPLTALLRVPNGELLKRPAARSLMRSLAEETAAVARAEHVDLHIDDPAGFAEDVARKTAANYSSMLQDIRRGAPTEIGAICGAITRAGQRAGIPTPVNEVCWRLVQALAETSEEMEVAPEANSI
jgi:2-dehydropantoate 2-reductase